MRIGFLITYFYPFTGGAENNCYYLAKSLAKKHEVHVFCSGKENSEEIIDGIHVHRSKEILRIGYYFSFYPSIIKSLLKYELDILHVHGFGFIQHDIAIRRVKKAYPNTRIVCTPHGPFMALKSYSLLARIIKNIYMVTIRKNLKMYNTIIQVNPYQWKWITQDYGVPKKKIIFLPNGITRETFLKTENAEVKKKYNLSGKFVITYVGRLQRYKGLDQILMSIKNLENDFKNLIFVCIGRDGGDLDRLKKIARDLNIEDRVIFTGEISEKDKVALLDISEMFIFPSEWEAFGIGMLEAMAKGNAVISSKSEGGIYLVGGKNGFLFDFGNVKQLSDRLRYLILNPRIRKKMQENNRVLAKSFIWEDIAKKLEKIYLKIRQHHNL